MFQTASRLEVAWDGYSAGSLEARAKAKREDGAPSGGCFVVPCIEKTPAQKTLFEKNNKRKLCSDRNTACCVSYAPDYPGKQKFPLLTPISFY